MKSLQTREEVIYMTKPIDEEDRKQQRLRRLGTRTSCCVGCGETNPVVFEQHHIAGRKHSGDMATVCLNCHRKLSDKQRDHVPLGAKDPTVPLAMIGHYLLGLADLLALVVEVLHKFGTWLIGQAMEGVTA
jgi:hypothetical protein